VERDRLGREVAEKKFSIPIRADAENYAGQLCKKCGLRILGTRRGYGKKAPPDGATRVIIATPA